MIKNLVKVVKTKKDKNGKEKRYINFYLVLDNGNSIPIEPVTFTSKNGDTFSSFRELNTIAVKVDEYNIGADNE